MFINKQHLGSIIRVDDNCYMVRVNDIKYDELSKGIEKLRDDKVEMYLGFTGSIKEVVDKILSKDNKEEYAYYAVYVNEDIVGIFYLYDIKWNYNRANISFGLMPNKRGMVMSFKRINNVIKYLLALGFNRLAFEIEDENTESLKVAKHLKCLGFNYEGKLIDNYGVDVHSNVYALVKRNYIGM